MERKIRILNCLDKLFNPKSVAVIGVSEEPRKLGYQCLKALLMDGYEGRIYPVHPRLKQLMGLRVYNSLDEIEDEIDLAVIAVSAPNVPDALMSCARKKIKCAIVISSGFKEIGGMGEDLERKIKEIAEKHKICIVGPNCFGAANLKAKLNATFGPGVLKLKPGNISIISQSGGMTGAILYHALDLDAGIAKFVSVGNRCNLDFADYIEYFYHDPDTKVIAIFLEGTEDARRFIEVAKRVTKSKPILVYKAGKTKTGTVGVKSHTGSLAGKPELYSAAFKQAGIIEVQSIRELIEGAKVLSIMKHPPRGNRVAVVTHTAGPSIVVSDILESRGCTIANLSDKTIEEIRKLLPFPIPISNPVDLLGFGYALPELYGETVKRVLADENVDLLITIYTPSFQPEIRVPAKEMVEAVREYQKPLIAVLIAPLSMKPEEVEYLENAGIPVFFDPESGARAATIAIHYYTRILKRSGVVNGT
ncbi:MAG: acetate--CoA ligase family protein [Candidatus Baldrarchaeia archaeon]